MDLNGPGWLEGTEWIGVAAAPFLGSFAAAASRRFAEDEPFVAGRSSCDTCGTVLRAWELVPLVSWTAQGGRCAHCDAAIGWRALIVELAYLTVTGIAWLETSGTIFWIGCLLGWTLLGLALIDLETYLLPDAMTLPLIAVGLTVSAFLGRDIVFEHALAAALGFLSLFAVAAIYRAVTGRDGLGMGDAKLFAATGAWIGLAALPGTLLLAAATGLVVELGRRILTGRGGRWQRLAFGPYLAFATWTGWIFGPLLPVDR